MARPTPLNANNYKKYTEPKQTEDAENWDNKKYWLKKHRDLGVCHFYIRLEETPELEDYLDSQQDVTLQKGSSTGINEYAEIQNRQNKWVDEAFEEAKSDNTDTEWLIHIDSDEIISGDLKKVQELKL